MKRLKGSGLRAAGMVAIAGLAMSACGGGGGTEQGQGSDQTLRFTNFDPENIAGPQTTAMGEAVEEYTDGRISFDYYWSGSLLPGPEVPSGIASGTADLGLMLTAYTPEDFPIGDWSESLMSLPAMAHPSGILQSGATHAEVVLSNEDVVQEFSEQGLKILAPVVPYSNFDLLCVDPVTDLESAEGKRVRVAGEVWAQEAAALGMQPVNLPPGEIYDGLQRGVIDCVVHHPPGNIGNSTWEVATHYSPIPFSGAMAYLVMSESTWNSLSPDDQDAVMQASQVYFSEFEQKSLTDYADFGTRAESEHDVTWHEPEDELLDVLANHQEDVRTGLPDSAPESLSDPEEYVAAYEGGMDEWEGIISEMNLDISDSADLSTSYIEGGELDLQEFDGAVQDRIFSDRLNDSD